MTLQPGAKLGNYELVEKIGAGGMGAVYKAYQPALGRYVAIKVLPPQTAGDPKFAERFAQEAKAIGKLRHPNIVTAFDFAHEGDLAFLVSEFIDGGTLADQLGAPLPLEYTLQLLTPIASALDYAHARGVVHRDIKPQNILLSHDGTPVLTDFGLAKIVGPGSGMTQAGSLMGTAEYIAPELAAGSEVAGPAADQYALGLIAYQMLCGRHPFPADNPLSALMAHVHKPVPIPSTFGIALPPGVEAALLRVLAKRPEERFPRCGDFTKALAGSAFAGMGAIPAMAPVIGSPTSPSQPPAPGSQPPVPASQPPSSTPIASGSVASAQSEPEVSPLLSPAALVTPIERAPSTPPSSMPVVPASVAASGTPTAIVPPRPLAKKSAPWWRRRRTLVLLVGILVIFVILNLPKQDGRVAGVAGNESPRRSERRASEPPSTTAPAPSATVSAAPSTSSTPAPTAQPTTPILVTATPTQVRTPTPVPTIGPTTTPVPTDRVGNTPGTATPITPGTLNSGSIDFPSDVDWYRFGVPANNQIVVEYRGKSLVGGAVALFVASSTSVGGVQEVGAEQFDTGSGATILATAPNANTYYVRVRSARGSSGTYSIAVALIQK